MSYPRTGREVEKAPDITVLPSLSAPIDEGQFYPKPRMGGWQIALRVLLLLGLVALVVIVGISHGSVLR